MKISVCITTFNETEERVKKLLDALNNQSVTADEIIIVDATPNFKLQIDSNASRANSKQYTRNKLQIIQKPNVSRSEGRNIAIKKAKNEIIAITDVGCIPHNDWLEKITNPFKKGNIDVVSGGYKMVTKNNFEKAESVFLGVKQNDINEEFMPSARSMAFTKTIWKKVGGFPEDLNDTAEDTVFNLNLIEAGAKFVTGKNAVVEWEMPATIKEFAKKIYKYAKGDAQSGIWWHPKKKFSTHNIKVLSIILRYLLMMCILFFSWKISLLLAISYLLFAYKKAKVWGVILQFVSDIAAMAGFLSGIIKIS